MTRDIKIRLRHIGNNLEVLFFIFIFLSIVYRVPVGIDFSHRLRWLDQISHIDTFSSSISEVLFFLKLIIYTRFTSEGSNTGGSPPSKASRTFLSAFKMMTVFQSNWSILFHFYIVKMKNSWHFNCTILPLFLISHLS